MGFLKWPIFVVPKCNEPGIWNGCSYIDISETIGYEDCRSQCKNTTGCTKFTYNPPNENSTTYVKASPLCKMFKSCTGGIATTSCPRCRSGESGCDPLKCGIPDCCQDGTVIEKIFDTTSELCRDRCNQNPNCTWYTFYPDFKNCDLLSSCSISPNNLVCESGEHGCGSPIPTECNVDKCYEGDVLGQSIVGTVKQCIDSCTGDCKYYSYLTAFRLCSKLKDKTGEFDEGLGTCTSGAKGCTGEGYF